MLRSDRRRDNDKSNLHHGIRGQRRDANRRPACNTPFPDAIFDEARGEVDKVGMARIPGRRILVDRQS
jgi:hypothetical protein